MIRHTPRGSDTIHDRVPARYNGARTSFRDAHLSRDFNATLISFNTWNISVASVSIEGLRRSAYAAWWIFDRFLMIHSRKTSSLFFLSERGSARRADTTLRQLSKISRGETIVSKLLVSDPVEKKRAAENGWPVSFGGFSLPRVCLAGGLLVCRRARVAGCCQTPSF